MSNDIMLDIETLAKSERSVVLSIGAIAFDAEKFGEDIEHLPKGYSALDFLDQKDRDVDLGTVRWWMNQKGAVVVETELEAGGGHWGPVIGPGAVTGLPKSDRRLGGRLKRGDGRQSCLDRKRLALSRAHDLSIWLFHGFFERGPIEARCSDEEVVNDIVVDQLIDLG